MFVVELNKVYCMDNLELMNQMNDESIDLIYCDILYGTGRKLKDYQDLKPQKEVINDFYIPRIKEMHRILKNTGSVYLQMDYRINHWIRSILDDVFGYENLKNEIIWGYRQGGSSKDCFARKHDTILWYSKSNKWIFNADDIRVEYNGTGGYQNSGKGVKNKNGKTYKPNPKGKIPEDWWDIPALTPMAKERVGYNTQKPKALLERIIKASSNKSDTVADFFCGSGTTGVVAKELGRNYIMCDISEKAVEVSEKRLNEI